LIGNPHKANSKLGWKPKYDLNALVKEMVQSDLKEAQKNEYLKQGGYETFHYFE
jgi:GDPmannose 4,6-dehydratase